MSETTTAPARPTGALTLGAAFRRFMAHGSPRLLIPVVAAMWALRFAIGDWAIGDLVIPAVILALEPFTEWVIHVFLLHWKPKRIMGRKVDPFVSRKHRAHHRNPKDEELIFVPFKFLVFALVIGAALYLLLLPSLRLAVMTMACSYTMLLVYEWTHFLIHSTYRPKTRFYRYVWRAHRLHHYRNENYWFGVTMHAADHVLRTFPEKDEVPASPTARTLGVDAA